MGGIDAGKLRLHPASEQVLSELPELGGGVAVHDGSCGGGILGDGVCAGQVQVQGDATAVRLHHRDDDHPRNDDDRSAVRAGNGLGAGQPAVGTDSVLCGMGNPLLDLHDQGIYGEHPR